jgi:hypothetical protein
MMVLCPKGSVLSAVFCDKIIFVLLIVYLKAYDYAFLINKEYIVLYMVSNFQVWLMFFSAVLCVIFLFVTFIEHLHKSV